MVVDHERRRMCPVMLNLHEFRAILLAQEFRQRSVGVTRMQVDGEHRRSAVEETELCPDRLLQVFWYADLLAVSYVLGGPDVPVECDRCCEILLRSESYGASFGIDRKMERDTASRPAYVLCIGSYRSYHRVVRTVQDRLVMQ